MGYYVKYHELQNTYHHICNQINAWNSELENVKQKMLEVALMQEIKGETANSIRSYILEIHIPLINFLQQVLAEYKTRMLEYVNDYNQIDSNENAKIAIDRLDEQITNIHAGMDAFQAIEESVAQAIGMVAGLVSVSVPSGERITNNYEKLGNKASKLKDEVGECEYSHLTSDFSNIEDMLSNILKIINGQSGKSNVTITAYQAGSISKVPTFQKLQEAASTQNIDFDGSTKESEDIIAGYGTKSILDIMRYEFTKFVKENKLNNIKKKILDNLNQHISKYQYDDFSTSDGFISGEDILVEMEEKILMGQRKNPAKNELIGGHSPNINNTHPKYAIEEIATNLDGTKKVKFVTQYPDGNLSNIKTSTVFPDTWTNSEIIEGIKTVGNSPPIGVRTSDGATLYRGIVNGVQIEVIKVRDVVTSGYPTGGIKTGLLPGFNNYD